MSSIEQRFFDKYSKHIISSSSRFALQDFPSAGSQLENMSSSLDKCLTNTYTVRYVNSDTRTFDVNFEYDLTDGKLVYNGTYMDEDSVWDISEWQVLDELIWMQVNDGWLADLQKAYPDLDLYCTDGTLIAIVIDNTQWLVSYAAALRLLAHPKPRPNFEQQFLDKYEDKVTSTAITRVCSKKAGLGITDIYTYKLDGHTVEFNYAIVRSDDDISVGYVSVIRLDGVIHNGWLELDDGLNGISPTANQSQLTIPFVNQPYTTFEVQNHRGTFVS